MAANEMEKVLTVIQGIGTRDAELATRYTGAIADTYAMGPCPAAIRTGTHIPA
jgi:hypothetical protein